MKKYIFLDFDDVIATEKSRYNLDKEACDLLTQIIEATDALIVVSSSWRKGTLEETRQFLSTISSRVPFEFPHVDRIVGQTIRAYHYVKPGIHLGIPRGVEIKQWIDTNILSDNGKNFRNLQLGVDYQYLILDDDSDMLLEHAEHFIKVRRFEGLKQDNVEQAIKILNNGDIKNQNRKQE